MKSEKGKVRNFVYRELRELKELKERGYYKTLPRTTQSEAELPSSTHLKKLRHSKGFDT